MHRYQTRVTKRDFIRGDARLFINGKEDALPPAYSDNGSSGKKRMFLTKRVVMYNGAYKIDWWRIAGDEMMPYRIREIIGYTTGN